MLVADRLPLAGRQLLYKCAVLAMKLAQNTFGSSNVQHTATFPPPACVTRPTLGHPLLIASIDEFLSDKIIVHREIYCEQGKPDW